MTTKYEQKKIGEFCKVIGGYAFKSADFTDSGVPVLKIKNISDKSLLLDNVDYLPESFLGVADKYKVKRGDVLISMTGSHITMPDSAVGRVARSRCDDILLLNQRVGKMQINEELGSPDYLYYCMTTPEFKEQIGLRSRGAANQANVSGRDIEGIEIPFPPLSTQQKIATILSNYDDLIENNLRQIGLLEETARLVYDEWFVTLQFPGYDKTPLNSETKLPTGWDKCTLKDYCSLISRGPSLNYELNGEEGVPVLNQSCVRRGEIELQKVLYSKKLDINKSDLYLQVNDILINSMGDGTLGRVAKNVSIDYEMIIHNCITVLRAKPNYSQYFLFYFVALRQSFFESVAHGSTGQSSLSRSLIEKLEITVPTKNLLNRFDEVVSPIWKKIGLLKKANNKLREARDILQPRLITGVIDIDSYDPSKFLKEAA